MEQYIMIGAAILAVVFGKQLDRMIRLKTLKMTLDEIDSIGKPSIDDKIDELMVNKIDQKLTDLEK